MAPIVTRVSAIPGTDRLRISEQLGCLRLLEEAVRERRRCPPQEGGKGDARQSDDAEGHLGARPGGPLVVGRRPEGDEPDDAGLEPEDRRDESQADDRHPDREEADLADRDELRHNVRQQECEPQSGSRTGEILRRAASHRSGARVEIGAHRRRHWSPPREGAGSQAQGGDHEEDQRHLDEREGVVSEHADRESDRGNRAGSEHVSRFVHPLPRSARQFHDRPPDEPDDRTPGQRGRR